VAFATRAAITTTRLVCLWGGGQQTLRMVQAVSWRLLPMYCPPTQILGRSAVGGMYGRGALARPCSDIMVAPRQCGGVRRRGESRGTRTRRERRPPSVKQHVTWVLRVVRVCARARVRRGALVQYNGDVKLCCWRFISFYILIIVYNILYSYISYYYY